MSHPTRFLQSLALRCKEQFEENCGALHVIFPNKRAGLYFASYLAEYYDKPVWSPVITSFESFVEEQQDKKLADELQLSFILYKAYKILVPSAEPFDAFLPWGEMILKDFNDIDNYLVETEHIFSVIKSQKELDDSFQFLSEEDKKIIQGFWQGFLPEPDKKQTEFIKTWSILDRLYVQFNELLAEQNLIYKGRLFRDFCEQNDVLEQRQVWFAGFNALTKAEEQIIKGCLAGGNSDIFWEIDQYYYQNEFQEAGLFFRAYGQDDVLGPSIKRDVIEQLNSPDKRIELVSAPLKMGQIMAANQKLDELAASPEGLKDTLVILADESYLPNLLDKLPASVSKVNVTMGWSIGHARFYILMQKIIALKLSLTHHQNRQLNYKEILSILAFNDLLGIDKASVDAFVAHSTENNRFYFSLQEVEVLLPVLSQLLRPTDETNEFLQILVDYIHGLDMSQLQELDKSVAVALHATFKRLAQASEQYQVALQMVSLLRLFKKLGNTIKLPFTGEIDGGLQVMGILETRNLSFTNVLILGMNEGSWPKDSSQSSFVPYNIRKAFDLPTTEHQDAMQAYLFYRLLHSTENLWVTYNNITEFNKNGELSRYIQQLKHESAIQFAEASVMTHVQAEPAHEITKTKEGEALVQLKRYLLGSENPRRLSPSALNTYIDCSLKFYFKYIEEIYEPKEIKEDIDPSLLGNLLHTAMEYLYEGTTELTTDTIATLENEIETAVKSSFVFHKLEVGEGQRTIGRQLIVLEVVKKFVVEILRADGRYAPFDILALESTDYLVDYPIETMEGSAKVALKGVIDRVDQKNQHIRIVDYKSGRDERDFSGIPELIDGDSANRNKAVFQLFYYAMLYKENHPDSQLPIQPLMYNSKDLYQRDFDGQIRQKKGTDRKARTIMNYQEVEEEFREVLEGLLTEIFNTSVNFTQTDDTKKCQYCPYIQICRRA
ncbi:MULTISPECIES: PD-(D/E)XK nuclease family protein [Reichenbachiella]|uniref:Exodeoxyribonuclease V, gamma subunit n=1 Tax=Reichenbachiella agariperforans TaxID=156994 RepID=A0A1M6KYT8_REIAG|nr:MULTISPECIES: PD-(D/E)XK nuclease family protein [Reichenbachiella]SHJ64173.1 Exodeoxyribonuclease V, gamma subunit [Reichenbachiella agariperforans]